MAAETLSARNCTRANVSLPTHGRGFPERKCPADAIKVEDEKAVVGAETCIDCGTRIDECPVNAITEGAYHG